MRQDFKHDVLGTSYSVSFGRRDEIAMSEEFNGECRIYSKEIKVCTEKGDCTEEEMRVRVQETVAHEFLHAYFNEAGLELDPHLEESLASFYMKNWRKLNNSILEVLDESGFLDN